MGLMADSVAVSLGGASDIAAVTEVNWSGISRDAAEVTNFSSASNYKEYIKGYKDAGEINFTCYYDMNGTTHNHSTSGAILEDFSDDSTNSTITFKYMNAQGATGSHTVAGIITNVDLAAAVGGVQTASVTVKCTGAPTFNAS